MTIVANAAGWIFDLAAKTIAWPDVHGDKVFPLPDTSIASAVYFGANYETSQAASRTVADGFRKAWAGAAPDRKAKDAPKSAIPASDSAEYVAALLAARKVLFDKNVAGYVVSERADAADPYAEELDRLARGWFQTYSIAKGQYALPAKKKVARDEDAMVAGKSKYATFGDALAAFVNASADSKFFALTVEGKAWPIKTKAGTSIADLLAAEARKRADAREAAKPQAAILVVGDDDPSADF